MQGAALPVSPEKVHAATYWSTAVDAVSTASDFAGMDTANAHLQDTADPGVTDRVLVEGLPGKKIVVNEVSITQTGGATGYVGTLAQEGETSDIIQFAAGQYGQARFEANFELETDKDLILYRAKGETGGATVDVNIVTVFYTYIDSVS